MSSLRETAGPVLAIALMLLQPAVLQAQTTRTAKETVQPLAEALENFSRSTGLQVLYAPDLTHGVSASPMVAGKSAEETLELLLRGTGLTYKFVNERTVTIVPVKDAKKNSRATVHMLQLAQAAEAEKTAVSAASGRSGKEAEVVVQAERDLPTPFSTANLDLTRTADDVLPFQVFTRREIELSGATDIEDFLQNRLPQNFNPRLDGEVLEHFQLRETNVDLRGWGETETVFLLNGRRLPPQYRGSQLDSSNAAPNLAGIPLAAIERIEILSSAGSVIYGANATGGVINIITRENFKGGQFSVSYQTPADVHAPKRTISLSYAQPLGPRTTLQISGNFSDSKPLHAGDRSDVTIERWRSLVLQREPARIQRFTAVGRIAEYPYGVDSVECELVFCASGFSRLAVYHSPCRL